ncbi:ankyrin repeat-containing domain protein [Aspergillus carlsbadensis]|nr:ankyrin repeat-containing domain protein [Aspergillus carlsbadensis]
MHLLELPLEIFHMILAPIIAQGHAETFTQLQLVNSKALAPDAYHYYAIRVVRQSTEWICARDSVKYTERDTCYTLSRSAALCCNMLLQRSLDNSTYKCTEAQRREGLGQRSDFSVHHLCAAACVGDVELIQSLLLNGADVNATSDIFGSPLLNAARGGHIPAVLFLLENGADPECDTVRWMTESERKDVQRFIFPHMDKEPWTPLGAAAFAGHGAITNLLLDARYALSRSSYSFFHAIIHASRGGHVEILEKLIATADFNSISPKVKTRVLDCALKESASQGHLASMQLLLDSGAAVDLSVPEEQEHTALWYAAFHGRNAAIELLLDRGADIDEGCMLPDGPLVIAGRLGFPRTVALLLDRGAEVNRGRVYAMGQIDMISPFCVIKVLLEKGVHKRDEDGAMRMLEDAHEANRQDLIDLFREYGVVLST